MNETGVTDPYRRLQGEDLIDYCRRLKSTAIAARDRKDYIQAIDLLDRAKKELEEEWIRLKANRGSAGYGHLNP